MTPITILTGFLGAGKTTLLNQLIQQNPQIRFGLIINEFGEIGVDGQLLQMDSGEELVELSNGCVCCIVRSDLQDAVLQIVDSGKVDYVIIETSGLAEPAPVAQTFLMEDLGGKVKLDGVLTVVDVENYEHNKKNYEVAEDQIRFADIILLNKIEGNEDKIAAIKEDIKTLNSQCPVIENTGDVASGLLIETGKWSDERLVHGDEHDHHSHHDHADEHENHSHEHKDHSHKAHYEHNHHHEHEDFDEVLFTTTKLLNPFKLDEWMQTRFPENVIRSKGFLRLKPGEEGMYLFQMVGAKKELLPFSNFKEGFNYNTSRLVLIGKNLDKEGIISDLKVCEVD